jgi:hypothetical protein
MSFTQIINYITDKLEENKEMKYTCEEETAISKYECLIEFLNKLKLEEFGCNESNGFYTEFYSSPSSSPSLTEE